MTLRSLALALTFVGTAHAAAPNYLPLPDGFGNGSVIAESGPFSSAQNWTFYTFNVPFLETATITVTPTSPDFDAFIAVWSGLEADTADYYDMTSGGVASVFVGSADGLDPFNTGVGIPASLSFVNDYGNDPFVLAVADYTDGLGAGTLTFTLATAVPEAKTYALMLAGLGLIGLAVRRRT